MPLSKDWSEWWRRFLDLAPDESANAVDFLRQRYVEEMQRIERFKQHAEKMHYPQYREKFLEMAKEKRRHAERIGEKIVALGGKLPDVPERRSTDENSWKSLLMALEDENRSADCLPEQLRRIGLEHPDITKFLQGISHEQKKHRDEIREMLMRSDPFALSLA
ncbi:MAG TPA: ferritin-like domain-containing protein [Acidobacteriota bacterium]